MRIYSSNAPIALVLAAVFALLTACSSDEGEEREEIVRGLKAFKVTNSANSEFRRYPSVVQPAQETKLSFEIAGKLKDITLEVGQRVQKGQVLAEIDPVSLELKAQSAEATLNEATAAHKTAAADLARKKQLLEKQYVTQSQFDEAQNLFKSTQAKLQRARRELELAKQDFSKAKVHAPFTGVLSTIDAKDFAQVSPGETILGIYSESAYEVSFSVPASIINNIKIGAPANITFPDLPGPPQKGHIKELGSRATQVSAFPVVVALDETPSGLNAGISAEVEISVALIDAAEGFLVPMSSFYFSSDSNEVPDSHREIGKAVVFVFDEATSTVSEHVVDFAGIRGNMAIVTSGISEGDIVASAGISYLHDGQKVKLLPISQ